MTTRQESAGYLTEEEFEPERHPIRAWLRSLPAEFRNVGRDWDLVRMDIADMWPLMWKANASQHEEVREAVCYNLGRDSVVRELSERITEEESA